MRVLKILLGIVVTVVVVVIVAVVTLFVRTSGDYPVMATVLDDPSLPQIKINDVQLHAESFGDASDPLLVVLHGGPGADYRSLLGLKALADHYQVVFYDQRGAGLSQRVGVEELRLEDYLDELDGVVAHYSDGRPVTLIGHSWGAMLAVAYMGQAPEKIARAVLMEPGFFNSAERVAWDTQAGRYMSGGGYFKVAMMAGFEAQHVSGPDDAAGDDYLIGKMAHVFANHLENPYHCASEPYDAPSWRFGALASQSAAALYDAGVDQIENGARGFAGPVLLLAGGCNWWLGEDLQRTHLALFSGGELSVITEAGHDMVWDNAASVLAEIDRFLSE